MHQLGEQSNGANDKASTYKPFQLVAPRNAASFLCGRHGAEMNIHQDSLTFARTQLVFRPET